MAEALQKLNWIMLSVVLGTAVHAAEKTPPFSAEAVQQVPGQQAQIARMYVSNDAVRTEYTRNQQPMAEIVFTETGRRILLMPQQRGYMEYIPDQPPPKPADQDNNNFNPCAGLKDVECKKLATEAVNGRQTVKWEITSQQDGNRLHSLHWIDTERHMPIRELMPDGSLSELKLLGPVKINGRNTEKWEMIVTRPDGEAVRSLQWYDPELKIAIREELKGGQFRELRNIRLGQQRADLFKIPQGFRKLEQPSQTPNAATPRGNYR